MLEITNITGYLKEVMDYVKEKENFQLLIRNIYKSNVLGQILFEYMEPEKYYVYIANADGDRPFANRTNDKVDDNEFPRGVLSSVPLETNYRIVTMKRETEDIFNMQIYQVTYTDSERLELKEIYNGSALGLYEPFLVRSVGEAVTKLKMKPIQNWEQQINKHSFNPVRTIETHLLLNLNPGESSILQGYNKEGQIIELSNTTKDVILKEEEEIAIAGIYRVFYYKKFKSNTKRFVSGIQLRHLSIHDVDEYLPYCEVERDAIVNVNFVNGSEMLGLAIGQNIHLIYMHITGFKSIRLTTKELEYVKSIDPIFTTK